MSLRQAPPMRVEAAQAIRDGMHPIPFRVRFYVDSYRAYLIADKLAKLSQAFTKEVIANSGGDGGLLERLIAWESTPAILAELIHGALRDIEDALLTAHEKSLEQLGCRVAYGRDLRMRANPFYRDVLGRGLDRSQKIPDDSFVNLLSDGVIFAPRAIDIDTEMKRLDAATSKDWTGKHKHWHDMNRGSLSDGKIYDKSGAEKDLRRNQDFVDKLAERMGRASRSGRYNIQWSDYKLLSEKGVDADLIVSAMDDLHQNEIDVFVFLTNDSDFLPLIQRIKDGGKAVYICGERKDFSKHLLDVIGGKQNFIDITDEKSVQTPEVWLNPQERSGPELLIRCLQLWRYYRKN